jgi:hypothetical protein
MASAGQANLMAVTALASNMHFMRTKYSGYPRLPHQSSSCRMLKSHGQSCSFLVLLSHSHASTDTSARVALVQLHRTTTDISRIHLSSYAAGETLAAKPPLVLPVGAYCRGRQAGATYAVSEAVAVGKAETNAVKHHINPRAQAKRIRPHCAGDQQVG